MSGSSTLINRGIWGLDDWLDLSPMAKLLYFTLTTSPTRSLCGCHEWHPVRLREMIGGEVEPIEQAGAELESAGVLVFDRVTGEVLIRSWMRHDNLCRNLNVAKGAVRERTRIASRFLKGVVVFEMRRIRDEHPEWKTTWRDPAIAETLQQRAVNPFGDGSPRGLVTDLEDPKQDPSEDPQEDTKGRNRPLPDPLPLTPTPKKISPPTASSGDYSPEFERWWAIYPSSKAKADAAKAFTKALKLIALDDLIAVTERYRKQTSQMSKDERSFIPYGATWLNGRRWEDCTAQPAMSPEQILQDAYDTGEDKHGLSRMAPEVFHPEYGDETTAEERAATRVEQFRAFIDRYRDSLIHQLSKGEAA